MRRLSFVFIILLIFIQPILADVWVNGYTRSNGTYVQGYWRSDPDGVVENNWSYKGNVNPYTGEIGTKNDNTNYTNSNTHWYENYQNTNNTKNTKIPSTPSYAYDNNPSEDSSEGIVNLIGVVILGVVGWGFIGSIFGARALKKRIE